MVFAVVKGFLLFIEIVSSLLLIVVVLIQKSRGAGAGMTFGAGVGESLFGGQVGNVLTKATVVLSTIFLVNTTVLAVIGGRRDPVSVTESVRVAPKASMPSAQQQQAPPPMTEQMAPMSDVQPVAAVGDIGSVAPVSDMSAEELPQISVVAPEEPESGPVSGGETAVEP